MWNVLVFLCFVRLFLLFFFSLFFSLFSFASHASIHSQLIIIYFKGNVQAMDESSDQKSYHQHCNHNQGDYTYLLYKFILQRARAILNLANKSSIIGKPSAACL